MEWFCILRLIIGLSFLLYASICDLKYRRVKNKVWILMGLCGIIILEAQLLLDKKPMFYHLLLIPIIVLFGDVFWNREPIKSASKKINVVPIVLYVMAFITIFLCTLYQFFVFGIALYFFQLLSIPIMIFMVYALYYSRLLHGGADAKALMSIAILVPFYPVFYSFPIVDSVVVGVTQLFFPFVLVVLLNAVLIQIVLPIGFFVYNVFRRDLLFPQCFFGYKMDIGHVQKKFVWLMEKIVDGKHVLVLFPRKGGDIKENVEGLREMGFERVWVTPQIPFIVPLTIGFTISFFVGNLLFGLIQWLS